MTNREWFKQAKFGMMVHFGLYSVLGGEWKGQRSDFHGEWIQTYYRIPNAEYEQIAKAFNPIYFNAEEWVKIAQDAGMQYMVVTSKHHDGFALFDSKYDDYNCVKGSPFGRDLIAELAEACQKHGMKLGLYYSQDQDWHEKDGGGYRIPWVPQRSWTNDWDFPENDKKDYSRVFETKIKTQMKEILTNYGELCLIWCDNPYTMTDEQSLELYEMIRKYQPNALVNSRIGNGRGDYCSVPDNAVEYDLEEDRKRGFTLFECPATLNDTWGYKSFDANWKSADKLFEIKESLNARGINYLLNVGPDHLGRIPAPSIDILHELGNKIRGQ